MLGPATRMPHPAARIFPQTRRVGGVMNVRFEPSSGLTGELTAPPDKSLSHRAALLGAMASYPVRIENYLDAADTTSTLDAVRALGALVEVRPNEVVVRGAGLREARQP